MSDQPKWLVKASEYMGLAEIHGPHNNPQIVQFWKDVGVPSVCEDETPWCAAFVSAVLHMCGQGFASSPGFARSYLNYGVKTANRIGAICVLERGPNNGHVGFVVGRYGDEIVLLGGNTSDKVTTAAFDRSRVLGYRWPDKAVNDTSTLIATFNQLPIVKPGTLKATEV